MGNQVEKYSFSYGPYQGGSEKCWHCSSKTRSDSSGHNGYADVPPDCAKSDFLYRVLIGMDQGDINKLPGSMQDANQDLINTTMGALQLPPCQGVPPIGDKIFVLDEDTSNPFKNVVNCNKAKELVNPYYSNCVNNQNNMFAVNRFPCSPTYNVPIASYLDKNQDGHRYNVTIPNPNYTTCMNTLVYQLSEPQQAADGSYFCVGDTEHPYVNPVVIGGITRPDGYDTLVGGQSYSKVYPIKAGNIDTLKTCQSVLPTIPWDCSPAGGQCIQIKGGRYSSQKECESDPQNICVPIPIIKPGKRSGDFIWLMVLLSLFLFAIVARIGFWIYKKYKK